MKGKYFISLLLSALILSIQSSAQSGFGYTTPPDSSSTSSGPVGTTIGTFAVSQLGAATYSIPIDCPQGLPGMTPQVAITYNSQSGNGVAGYGCSISGISVITRVPRDIFHDGAAAGITYTSDDAFSLDGQRLILTQAAAGSDTAVYVLENDPMTRIVLRGLMTQHKDSVWFSVERSDGMKLEYGLGQNGHIKAHVNGTFKNLSWLVGNATSPSGNKMSYTYTSNNNCRYLSQITYGYNNDARISFSYETRPDTVGFMLHGLSCKMTRRLKTVKSQLKSDGSWHTYRQYNLIYNQSGDGTLRKYSRLVSMTESNGDENLKPISLGWEYLPEYSPTQTYLNIDYLNFDHHFTIIPDESTQMMAADFNGDGISDILQKSYVGAIVGGGNVDYYTDFYFRLSQASGGGSVSYQNPLRFRLPPEIEIGNWSVRLQGPMAVDSDGDGLNDLLVPYSNIGNGNHFTSVFYIYGKNIVQYTETVQSKSYTFQNSNEPPLYAYADFDRDGRSDIAIMEAGNDNGGSYHCQVFFGGATHDGIREQHFTFTLPAKPKHFFSSDYDSDGLSDLLVATDSGYVIIWNRGGSSTACLFSDTGNYSGNVTIGGYRMYEGDFNGDGTPDFLVTRKDNSTWRFAMGNGDGTFLLSDACAIDAYEQSATDSDDGLFYCSVFDIDGDGRSDAVISKAVYSHTGLILYAGTVTYWMLSDGNRLVTHRMQTSQNKEHASPRRYITGDFNGDGLAELACYGHDCYGTPASSDDTTTRIYYNSGITAQTAKVNTITDGLGNTTSIAYGYSPRPAVYSKGSDSVIPSVITLTQPLNLVAGVMTGNGAAGHERTKYHYTGLKYHTQGKGLLGMDAVRNTNLTTGIVKETSTVSRDVQSLLASLSEIKEIAGGQTATTRTRYKHFAPISGEKAFFSHPDTVWVTDLDGFLSTAYYTFDENKGVPTQKRTVNDGGLTVTSYAGYVKKGGRWLPGEKTTTVTYTGKPPFYDKNTFVYNAKGLCTSATDHANTPYASTTSYTYDSYGNMLSSALQDSAGNLEAVQKKWVYDARKRFVMKHIERSDTVAEYTRDLWGNARTVTDKTRPANPLVTRYEYDGWGNIVSETSPEGICSTYKKGWGADTLQCYWTLEQGMGRPWVKTWHDSHGRVVLTQGIGQGELPVYSARQYNACGLLSQKADSRGNTTVTETLTYDARGRVLTDIVSTGGSTSYSYLPRKVTSIVNGRSSETEYDAWGNIIKATDALGNATTYAYVSCGKPSSVTSCGATVTMEYDEVGNQKKLIDPDAGTMAYTYDAYGRIKTQKDGRNYTTTNTYDAKGRLASSTTAGTVTTYTYGDNASNMGLLVSTTRGSNTIAYDYDQYGRVSQESRTLFGQVGARTFRYTYGSNGMLSAILYPGPVNVGYQYDSYGNRSAVTVGGTTVWQMDNVTAQDSAITTKVSLGGNLKATETADLAGRVTGKGLSVGSAPPFRSMTFTYDAATGNMTGRTGMSTEHETFAYDGLDRLTAISHGGNANHEISYAPNGNITSQTGPGRYYYEGSKPHAVTAVDNTCRSIPTPQLDTQFNTFGKVSSIRDYGRGEYRMLVEYGPDNERWRTRLYKDYSTLQRTIYYLGDYEEVIEGTKIRRLYHLGGGVLYKKQNNQPDSVFYLFTDHLGSVVSIVDQNGGEKFSASYDAWGNQTVTRNDIKFHRGYTGHEMLPEFRLINMNGRLYDPQIGRFLSTDNYVQEPWNSQNFNRYSYCLNNPLKYKDPSGELAWFIPVIAGAVIGAYTGASIQSHTAAFWNWKSDAWKGAIAGGIIGAAIGFNVSSAMYATNASNITGLAVDYPVLTKAAGVTNSILQNGAMNIGINTITGGGWDGAWKAGLVGMATGAWSVTGGFGMAKGYGATSNVGKLIGKLGYQMIGTTSMSIGNNWASNKALFSKLTLGVGPVNLTIGKGQKLLQWENNIGNILSNSFGLINTVSGGKAQFDMDNLTFVYKGGLRDKYFTTESVKDTGFGSYAIFGYEKMSNDTFTHEMHHLWQSRAMNNLFWPTYSALGLSAVLAGGHFINDFNYYEQIGWLHYWYE